MVHQSTQDPTEKHGSRKAHVSAYNPGCAKAVMMSVSHPRRYPSTSGSIREVPLELP